MQKVMSVLSPVVSLLDGLTLSAPEDQELVADIKKKLASVGGQSGESCSRGLYGHRPVPRRNGPVVDNNFLRGYRPSAIAPRSPRPLEEQIPVSHQIETCSQISSSYTDSAIEQDQQLTAEPESFSACCGFLEAIQKLLPQRESLGSRMPAPPPPPQQQQQQQQPQQTPATPHLLGTHETITPDIALAMIPEVSTKVEAPQQQTTSKGRVMEISDIHPRVMHQHPSFVTKRVPIQM